MTTFEMTPEQAAALRLDRNIAVSAGAGTGKTRVLVERYLTILDSDSQLSPKNIVAITFTRKAAAEMRERIRKNIMTRLKNDSGLLQRDDRYRYVTILDQLPHAPISTIHGFAADILREFAIPAGLDPGFGILEDNMTLHPGRSAAVRAMRRTEKEMPDIWQTALLFFDLKTLESHLSFLAGKPDVLPAMERQLETFPDTGHLYREQFSTVDIRTWLERLDAVTGQTPAKQRNRDTLMDILDKLESLLNDDDPGTLESVVGELKTALFTNDDRPRKSVFSGDAVPLAKELQQELAFLPELSNISMESEKFAHQALAALYPMAKMTLDEQNSIRRHTSMLTYDDLERLTWELLTQSDAAEPVIERLQKRYKYFMIDEFQDTNPMQWQMLKPLITDSEGVLLKDKLFVVGDPKQSIYGFRNADVTVFKNVREKIVSDNRRHATLFHGEQTEWGDLHIDRNFRSRKAILDFTDVVCGAVMTAGKDYDIEYEQLKFGRDIRVNRPDDSGEIGFLMPAEMDETQDTKTLPSNEESWADLMASHMIQLKREGVYDWKDIAVMFPRRTRLETLMQTLKYCGIPFVVYKGVGFWQTPEIRDLTAFVNWLADSENRTALYTVLRSPLFNISDEALLILARNWPEFPAEPRSEHYRDIVNMLRWPDSDSALFAVTLLNKTRQTAGIRPLAHIVESFLTDTGGWGAWNAEDDYGQVMVNIEKFLDNLTQLDREGVAPLWETAIYLSDMELLENKEEEAALTQPDQNRVTLMTVHAAKGLQFPVVYLTDIEQQIRMDRGALLTNPESGAGLRLKHVNPELEKYETRLYREFKQDELDRETAERKRLMYVAFTRARDRLYLVHRPTSKASIEKADPAKNRMFDWIVCSLNLDSAAIAAGVLNVPLENDRILQVKCITHLPMTPPAVPQFPSPDSIRPAADRFKDELLADADKMIGHIQRSDDADDTAAFTPKILPAPVNQEPVSVAVTTIKDFLENEDEYYKKHVLHMVEHFRGPDSDPARESAKCLGNAYHRLLELHPELDESAVENAAQMLSSDLSLLDESVRNDIVARFHEMVRKTRLWPLHSDLLGNRGHHEVPFNIYLKNGIVHGIIDLLIRIGGKWHVVDYKTDRKPDNLSIDEWLVTHRDQHRFQMSVYALAVRQIDPDNHEPVPVVIYFADVGQDIRFEFTSDELNRLEQKLDTTMDAIMQITPSVASTEAQME
jgi:ATP-dependent helicase/nuclease subunit A